MPLDPSRKVVVSRECEAVILAVLQDAVVGMRSLGGPIDRITSHNAVLFHGHLFHMEDKGRVGFPRRGPGCVVIPRLCFAARLGRALGGTCLSGDLQGSLPLSLVSTAAIVVVVVQWEVAG